MTDKMSAHDPWLWLSCDVQVGNRRCGNPAVGIAQWVTNEGPVIYPCFCEWHDTKDRIKWPVLIGVKHQWARLVAYRQSMGLSN